jgi:hypothetical protein
MKFFFSPAEKFLNSSKHARATIRASLGTRISRHLYFEEHLLKESEMSRVAKSFKSSFTIIRQITMCFWRRDGTWSYIINILKSNLQRTFALKRTLS